MKKLLPVLIAVLALAAVPAKATTCVPGNMGSSSYGAAGFTCTIGSLTFSNFLTNISGSIQPPAAGVTVTPITTAPDGFTFNPALGVSNTGGGYQVSDVTIYYTISGPGIDDLDLGFNGAYSGTGMTDVSELWCLNAATLVGCSGANAGLISVSNPPPVYNNTITFAAPVSMVSVAKDMLVDTGSGIGGASITSVTNNYSQVPESASLTLLGLGLLGLAVAKRSKLGQLSL